MADGIKSPRMRAAVRKAIRTSGLSKAEVGRRLGKRERENLQRRLRGDVGFTPQYARRLEKALELRGGAIENLVLAEQIRIREAEVQAEIRQLEARRRMLRESRLRLS